MRGSCSSGGDDCRHFSGWSHLGNVVTEMSKDAQDISWVEVERTRAEVSRKAASGTNSEPATRTLRHCTAAAAEARCFRLCDVVSSDQPDFIAAEMTELERFMSSLLGRERAPRFTSSCVRNSPVSSGAGAFEVPMMRALEALAGTVSAVTCTRVPLAVIKRPASGIINV
jgi:hypothetical protein